MSDFGITRAGQKVVYIMDRFEPWPEGRDTLLDRGAVCTVKSFVLDCHGFSCITIFEVEPCSAAGGWWIGSFRPVDQRKTDISDLVKLGNVETTKAPGLADA